MAVALSLALGCIALGAESRAQAGSTAPDAAPVPPAILAAADGVAGERLAGDVAFLADDMLEGRGTGTRGYDLAAKYVANRFATLGLEPAGSDGYLQPVPFRCATLEESKSSLALTGPGGSRQLVLARDAVLSPDLLRAAHAVSAPLVFVGYGVSAPELGYDDYAGVDVRGKIVVELRGAPPRFSHDERAFYSSSLQKDRMAAAHGAVGILGLLKPADAARQPWPRSVRQSRMPYCRWTDEHGAPANVEPTLEVGGFLSPAGVEMLFADSPTSFARVAADAEASRAHSFPLGVGLAARRETRLVDLVSPNVAGVLPGSDPALAHEAIVVSAHLDHLGLSEPVNGDAINNGAYDNASGTAMMLEVARAFALAGVRPRRTLLFLAVTGEEKGLQGSDYFARHPAPRGLSVVGNVNVDEILMLRPITSVIAFGAEHSSLGPQLERAASMLGLRVVPDPMPDEVIFVRSDQFSFVKQGVPGIFPVSDMDGGEEAAAADRKWNLEVYHSPSDDMHQVFDWASGAKFTRMAFLTTWFAADDAQAPRWNAGDFFGERFGKRPAKGN